MPKMQKNSYFMQKNARNMSKSFVKPYNMAVLDDNSAEINMYGEVVMETPVDYWTGEKIDGLFIAVQDFLKDLEELKDKSKITVHINSGGGDLYAGLAIYNRLKALDAEVITINDGLAASAASLIFQAGDIRKMNAGSNLMAHGVAGFLFGYYNVEDLEELTTQFKAHNKAIVNVYAEAMGVDFEAASDFVKGETWLTGEEAIEKGLADELIGEEPEPTNKSLMQKIAAKAAPVFKAQFPNMGEPQKAMTAAVPPIADNKSIEAGGNEDMEIKTVDELRAAFPEFVAQIENAAKDNAVKDATNAERSRIQGIEAIENTIADKNLINEAKYGENPMSAEQLALKALQAQSAIGTVMLNDLEADGKDSGAEDVEAAPNKGEEGEPEPVDVEAEAKNIVNIFKEMNGGKK